MAPCNGSYLKLHLDCQRIPTFFPSYSNMSDNTSHLVQVASGVEFIFLGTGTSGSLPNVSCLTAPETDTPCKTCLSTLRAEGKKNVRRNTSAVMRIEGKDGKKRYVHATRRLV